MIKRMAQRARAVSAGLGPREQPGYPHFRRNYLLGILNGGLFMSGLSFFNKSTIIPVFLSGLHAPSIVIAITALFENLGWHLPQLLASKFVVHLPRKMPLYRLASGVRLAGLLMAVGAAPLSQESAPAALVLFVVGYGIFAIAGGFSGIVFTDVVAKTTPKQKRGSYFGWRAVLSGVAGLVIGFQVITPIFTGFASPTSYLISFAIGAGLIALSFFVFNLVREPVQDGLPAKRTMRAQLTTARRLMFVNHRFRRFVALRMLVMLWFSGVPFFMLFAKERLGANDAEMGKFISWEYAGLIIANLFWGAISNRIGNRVVLVISCSMAVVVSVISCAFSTGLIALPVWVFGFVFFMAAGIDSGVGNGGLNYALEIVPESERATYVGMMNTLIACALCLAGVIGSLRDVIGYTGLFVFTGAIGITSLVVALRLPEPRRP